MGKVKILVLNVYLYHRHRHRKKMMLDKNLLGTKFGDVQFQVQRSYRYSLARQKHYEFWSAVISFCIIVFTGISGYVFSTTEKSGLSVLILPVAVILISTLDLLWKPSKMASVHKMLAKRFILLDMQMTTSENKDASEAEKFQKLKLEIDLDEPLDVEAANILSHNELCGANELHHGMWQMNWFQRKFAQWNVRPKKWVTVDEYERKKRGAPAPA